MSAAVFTTALGALLLAGAAQAQVYRVVGPDGRVTYSDKPPAQPAREVSPSGPAASAGSSGLPYQLQQTAQRYPVTLYTGKDCAPCGSGRNLLINRGIPFSEKTVESNDDIAALQRLTGAGSLPVLTIGAQRLQGYSDAEWMQYLDAAGYPKASQLPSSYRRPAATPLAAASAAPAASRSPAASAADTASAPAPAPAQPSVAPPRGGTNPAGIRF
ncbi:glutaredoxin family protein [Ottowia testudinis]|uniref:Glutaredoxin family protein n=1 Tax=Ottowia testudinis TaxID=2816950 RepID=A0A975CLM5_9BURK|nr:glutaredoxin family protein [Ottowia testudinis]